MERSHDYKDEDMIPVGDAAELLQVHPSTLRRWADDGRLPVYRTPTNQRRFRVGDLRNTIDRVEPNGDAA